MICRQDAEQLIAQKRFGQNSLRLGAKYTFALRAPLDVEQHELLFGFQRFSIQDRALTSALVSEQSSAVGTSFRQFDVNNSLGFVRHQGFSTIPLVPRLCATLQQLVSLKAVRLYRDF
jgi:hypothetical protein